MSKFYSKKNKLSLFCLIVFHLFGSLSLSAQILNIEKQRMDEHTNDSSGVWYGYVDLKWASFNRSAAENDPVRLLSVNADASIAHFTKFHNYQFINSFDYFGINDNTFINAFYSHIRTTFMDKKTVAYELFGQYQWDVLRGLNVRWLSGGGLRFNVVNKENFLLAFGTGAMFEFEEWREPQEDTVRMVSEGQLVSAELPKSTNYMTTNFTINDFIFFNMIFYYQVGYDQRADFFRHRISTDSNLTFKFNDKLSFVVSGSFSFENRPIVPITKAIYSLSNGIRYTF